MVLQEAQAPAGRQAQAALVREVRGAGDDAGGLEAQHGLESATEGAQAKARHRVKKKSRSVFVLF